MQIKPEQNNVFCFLVYLLLDDPQHCGSSSGKIILKVYPKETKTPVVLTSGQSLFYSHLKMPKM